jgi:hypothetical protein
VPQVSIARPTSRWLDRLGVSASVICVVHCVALTAAVAIWPALWMRQRVAGVEVRWLLAIEFGLAALSVLFALSAVAAGWRRHRRPSPGLLLGAGTTMLAVGVFSRLHVVPGWGTALVVVGGILLVAGHTVNLRLPPHGH